MKCSSGRISVIMPAYNEGDIVRNNVERTLRALESAPFEHELIVVDDGSTDGTIEALKDSFEDNDKVKIVRYEKNGGKGNALRYGHKFAEGDYVAFLDSDLDLPPEQLCSLYRQLNDTNADIVIGSKWHPESELQYPLFRRIMSRVYYCCVRILFNLPIRDTQTGIKLFRREVLDSIFPKLLVKRYAFDLELLVNAKHRNYCISEAPVCVDFHKKFGRIGIVDIANICKDTLAIYYRLNILKYYDDEYTADLRESESLDYNSGQGV